MGKVISRLNLFKACRDDNGADSENKQENKKEEIKHPVQKIAKKKGPMEDPPVEVSSSDVLIDEDAQKFTQLGFRNDDKYFTPEEHEYYRKLYANEKVEQKHLTKIKQV